MKILCCGDRNWKDASIIRRELSKFDKQDLVIIHGNANGADRLSGGYALTEGIKVEVYPAMWAIFGRSAGPIRNMQMLKEGKPDLVLAFHTDITNSKGTKHMVSIAIKAGIKVIVIDK